MHSCCSYEGPLPANYIRFVSHSSVRSDWEVVVLTDRALTGELSQCVEDPKADQHEKHYPDSPSLLMGIV